MALATLVATYALIVLGGVVRVTDSGDACPDWPRCHGELVPPLGTAVLIEFSHRLLASAVGLLVLAMAYGAWRWARRDRVVFGGALLAVGLVAGQVVLGGMTVLHELPSSLVMAHLALGSTLFLALLVVCLAAFRPEAPRVSGAFAGRSVLLAVAALATFALMLTGSYVSGSGAGLAFRDWPLFDGRLMPEGGRLAMIHATHRFAALAVGLLLAHIAGRAWRRERSNRPLVLGATAALALFVAQALVGAANIWTLLQPAAGAAHLALAELVLAVLVATALLGRSPVATAHAVVRERLAPAAAPEAASAGGTT
jgi:heme A synthase